MPTAFETFISSHPSIAPYLRDGWIYEIARAAYVAGQSDPSGEEPPLGGVTFITETQVDQKISEHISELHPDYSTLPQA